MPEARTVSAAEVARHNTADDCWISVDGNAFNVTSFLDEHPGGRKILMGVAGKDASKQFEAFHGPNVLRKHGPRLLVGRVGAKTSSASSSSGGGRGGSARGKSSFGEGVPYGDPYWYDSRFSSPYYTDEHRSVFFCIIF